MKNGLQTRNCKDTTINQLFRTLRSVFNKAIDLDIIKHEHYPFAKFKLSKFNTTTPKRSISKDDIHKILSLELPKTNTYASLSKDIFIFSYFCAGINFSDIALLKPSNITDDTVKYARKKTGKTITFPLCHITKDLIQKYTTDQSDNDYIFPILDKNTHITALQVHNRIHKALTKVDNNLKALGETIGLKIPLTTYVARQSEFCFALKIS